VVDHIELGIGGLLTYFHLRRHPPALASGSVRKTSIAPSGKQNISNTSDDGPDTTITSTCGLTAKTFSGLDREFGYISPTRTTITSPAGRMRESNLVKTYTDADTNGIPEQVHEQRTLNGKSSALVQDIGQSRLAVPGTSMILNSKPKNSRTDVFSGH